MSRNDVAELVDNAELAYRILDYFERHPQAKDTVEGIARWWVQDDPVEVRRVLEKLVQLKLVGKRANASFDLYYAGNGNGQASPTSEPD